MRHVREVIQLLKGFSVGVRTVARNYDKRNSYIDIYILYFLCNIKNMSPKQDARYAFAYISKSIK